MNYLIIILEIKNQTLILSLLNLIVILYFTKMQTFYHVQAIVLLIAWENVRELLQSHVLGRRRKFKVLYQISNAHQEQKIQRVHFPRTFFLEKSVPPVWELYFLQFSLKNFTRKFTNVMAFSWSSVSVVLVSNDSRPEDEL